MNFDIVAIIIPGLKQFKNGRTKEGLIWLIGTLVGYLGGFVPGLIIHSIYIWKYFGKKMVTIPSGIPSNQVKRTRIDLGNSVNSQKVLV